MLLVSLLVINVFVRKQKDEVRNELGYMIQKTFGFDTRVLVSVCEDDSVIEL